MGTTTARILQSHGLNANIGQTAARELGLTDDTERPAIGTTVAGGKFIGTEELLTITVPTPAAIPILRRSQVSIFCDTATAGAHIDLDIRAGAQVAGYRVMVFTVGPDTRLTSVQYATGVIDYVPAGTAQEFVWTGSVWSKVQSSWAEKYLLGDMLMLDDTVTIGPKMPLVNRAIDNVLSETNYPTYVPYLRGIKCKANGVSDITVTVAGSNITFPNTPESNALLTAIQNEATVAAYVNGGEIANFTGGTDYATAATQQSVNVNGTDYVITGLTLVSRIMTVTGSPTAGSQTAIFYAHRKAGSTTTAYVTKIGGFIPAPVGDAGLELVAGKRKMDREQTHWHDPGDSVYRRIGSGGSVQGLVDSLTSGSSTTTGRPAAAMVSTGTDGTPRTGKTTDPRTIARCFFNWAGVYK